jgi:hypothetical protein
MGAMVGEKSYPLRIDPALYEQIRKMGQERERSANWIIGRLLRKALAEGPEWQDDALR